ncbi:hypothetical protein [Methylophaga thiooxydans]|nr:hypothetical protein [Methylophaga thiooxydans]
MADKYQSRTDLLVENASLRGSIATMRAAEWSKTIRWFIAGSALVLGLYLLSPVAISWAGKTTKADIGINAKIHAEINKDEKSAEESSYLVGLLGGLFGVFGILYGRGQSRHRKNVVERYQPYKEMYEKEVDSKRTSSDLTPRGETRPEDV